MIRFGPSGNSESFYQQGYKSSVDMPKWLYEMGLNAYEYQMNKGVRIGNDMAREIGEEALKYNIFLSIHAPYYINMASIEEEKRINSKRYIIETMIKAKLMNAKRVVIHSGSCSKVSREWALEKAIFILKEVILEADEMKLSDITISPEVLGKINQLGSLDEILLMCDIDDRILPTIDFGHVHARGLGCLNTYEDFEFVIKKIINGLGYDRAKHFHCHFSRIEFTKGGEKKHRQLIETEFGPDFGILAKVLHKYKLEPVIICESNGNMAEDALKLKDIYYSTKLEEN